MPEPCSSAIDAIRADVSDVCGGRIFTVTAINTDDQLARRIYTSHPDEYPRSGTKPIQDDQWTRHVIVEQKAFVANSTEEFSAYFPDHAVINALGCHSALNVPVMQSGRTIATVNILDVAGRFDDETVQRVLQILDRNHAKILSAVAALTKDPCGSSVF